MTGVCLQEEGAAGSVRLQVCRMWGEGGARWVSAAHETCSAVQLM